MGYHYGSSQMWLDDLVEIPEPGTGYALCQPHADRLSPPRGWTFADQRSLPRLFAPLEVA
jgi:hypothetical protein